MRWVEALLDELEVDAAARRQLWGGTAAAWLGRERTGAVRAASVSSSPASDLPADDAADRPFRLRDVCF